MSWDGGEKLGDTGVPAQEGGREGERVKDGGESVAGAGDGAVVRERELGSGSAST